MFPLAYTDARRMAPVRAAALFDTPAYQKEPNHGHLYTAPYDMGLMLKEIPVPLHRSYMDDKGQLIVPRDAVGPNEPAMRCRAELQLLP